MFRVDTSMREVNLLIAMILLCAGVPIIKAEADPLAKKLSKSILERKRGRKANE
jgi:hypothetical protein